MRGPEDVPWANVSTRCEQLQVLAERLTDVESRFISSIKAMDNLTAGETIPQDVYEENQFCAFEFRLLAETCFMFCEAALNTLAEAVAEAWGEKREGRSWSFKELTEFTAANKARLDGQPLVPFMDRMRGLKVGVLLPRAVLSAHPPARLHAGGIRSGPGKRAEIDTFRLWPGDVTVTKPGNDVDLQNTISLDVTIPPELGGYADLIASWAIQHAGEQLSDTSVKALWTYVWKHGLSASPSKAIERTRAFLIDVARALGHSVT